KPHMRVGRRTCAVPIIQPGFSVRLVLASLGASTPSTIHWTNLDLNQGTVCALIRLSPGQIPRCVFAARQYRRRSAPWEILCWNRHGWGAKKLMSAQSCSKESYLAKTILAAAVMGFVSLPALSQERNPERNAYFGETHLHTSWSVDAWVMGN